MNITEDKINIVEDDLEKYARVLLKTKSRAPLDTTERLLLVQIKKDLLHVIRMYNPKLIC